MSERKTVVILGGGPAGLCAAYNLMDAFDVTVLEKQDHVAGLAACFQYGDKTIPKYYHHIFHHDHLTRKYFALVAGTENLHWKRIRVGICARGRVYSFTDPLSLMAFDYLSPWGRIRYGLFGFYVLYVMNPGRIDDRLDAERWLLKYAGREVTDKIFYQLYARNKFNIPLSEISARQFAHRLKAKEALGVFGFPKPGLHTLFEGFERRIAAAGGRVLKKAALTAVDLERKTVAFEAGGGERREIAYDFLINTIPIPEFLKVQKGLPAEYAERIARIRYCPVVSVVFATKKELSKHYWLNVFEERAQIIMQHSILNDDFDDKIAWAARYGGSEEDLPLDEEVIAREYLADVQKFFPDAQILWSRVFKELYASPIYDREYFQKKPDYRTPVKDLFFAGIAVTYPKIRNINTALESGEIVAGLIKKDEADGRGA